MNGIQMPALPDTHEKVAYQVIISRLDGALISEPEYRQRQFELIEKGIGGFILFGGVREKIKPFIAELQSLSRIPLFIAADIERGTGQQVQGMTFFPSQMAFAAAIDRIQEKDLDLLSQAIEAIAAETSDIGINMPLIPVLDVNRNPDNPIICTRAFSDDPELTGWFGSRYIKILEGKGLMSCAKHFPGHGDTSTDSHIELPVIRNTRDDLISVDLSPFRRAIEERVSSIMIGHLSVPAFDSRPASLSRKIITGLLKDTLGFTGLVLTDALNMHALREFGDVGLECLKAGADILLHPDNPDTTAAELLSALEEKRLDPGILEAAVKKIIEAKAGLNDGAPLTIDFESNAVLSKTISQKAITLVKNTPGLLPLVDSGGVSVFFSEESRHFEISPLKDFCSDSDNSNILLIALFTSVSAWKGSSGISDEERQKLSTLISKAKKSIVVSFGSPYVLRYFNNADVLIAAYDSTVQAQEAVINCLLGVTPFTGLLPVHIPEVSP
jgi:beta-glucosidase-like glycosyl hydrolase